MQIVNHSFFIWVLLNQATAMACPLCHTDTAREVRSGLIFSMGRFSTTAGVILPFLLIGLIVSIMNVISDDYLKTLSWKKTKNAKH